METRLRPLRKGWRAHYTAPRTLDSVQVQLYANSNSIWQITRLHLALHRSHPAGRQARSKRFVLVCLQSLRQRSSYRHFPPEGRLHQQQRRRLLPVQQRRRRTPLRHLHRPALHPLHLPQVAQVPGWPRLRLRAPLRHRPLALRQHVPSLHQQRHGASAGWIWGLPLLPPW